MFTVYIILSNQGKLYVGQTGDLGKRIKEHNEIGRGYTSKFRPWELIHSENFDSRKSAMRREKYLKTGAGRDWIKNNIKRA